MTDASALPSRERPAREHCWCGASATEHLWSGRYWKGRIARAALVRCASCGTIRSGALAGITVGHGDGPGGTFVNLQPSGWERVNAPIIVRHHMPGPLLEVGSNTGMLLDLLRDAGVSGAQGLEPNPACAAAARARGHRIDVGWFIERDTPPGEFANIVMSHVFEHTDDPLGALNLAAARLRSDGRLMLFVPNIDSRRAQQNFARWKPLNPVDHVWHFGPPTLAALVQSQAQFEPVAIFTTPLEEPRWTSPRRIWHSLEDRFALRAGAAEQLVAILRRR